jgi:hypothetical protein
VSQNKTIFLLVFWHLNKGETQTMSKVGRVLNIVGRRRLAGGPEEYLVHRQGEPLWQAKWEPGVLLGQEVPDLVIEFDEQFPGRSHVVNLLKQPPKSSHEFDGQFRTHKRPNFFSPKPRYRRAAALNW